MRTILASLLLFLIAPGVSRSEAVPAAKLPVFISLFSRIDDHVDIDRTEGRIRRLLAIAERYRARYPQSGLSVLIELDGMTSEVLASRNQSTHLVDLLKKAQAEGTVDIGYNGYNEPTPATRPQPSFRLAKTPEERFLARETPLRWFLTEHKDFLSGDPDPNRPGGLKETQQVFGSLASVSGVITRDLGGDLELVNVLRTMNVDAVLPGIPEGSTWPARNLHGYGVSAEQIGKIMGKASCSAEAFWKDGALRISDFSGSPVKVISAHAGPKEFKDVLEKLDRSRMHVLRVQLAPDDIYVKTEFLKTWDSPSRYAYENPKNPGMPDPARRTQADITGEYGKEDELLQFILEEFLPANKGSHMIGLRELHTAAVRALPSAVSAANLSAAVDDLLAQQKITTTFPPSYTSDGKNYFSLAELFSLLANALAEKGKTGKWPSSIELRPVYGPIGMASEMGPHEGRLTDSSVIGAAAALLPALNDAESKPVPSNAVPGWITVGSLKLNASQFLTAMAEVYKGEKSVMPKPRNLLSAAGMMYPRTRDWSEEGFVWTLKPAVLDFQK